MTSRRVVVTGLGIISPLALDRETHWRRLLSGESVVDACHRPECSNLPAHLEATVRDFNTREAIPDRVLRKLLSPSAAYPVAAAGEALSDAGLPAGDGLLVSCGLYVGSVSFDVLPETFLPAFRESVNREGVFEMARFAQRGMRLLDPLFLVKALPNGGLCGISIQYQILGPNINITNGPVSGLQAVAAAAGAIRRGEVDVALAGGYDSLVRIDAVIEHLLSGRLSSAIDGATPGCRPFDMERGGFALGEGAVCLVVEEEANARKRGAPAYGEIVSFSQTSTGRLVRGRDGHDGDGLLVAARQALEKANRHPSELSGVFGDGLATQVDDTCEANAFQNLVGDAGVAFTAATGAQGFTGAATGVFSLAHALLSIRDHVVPPLTGCIRMGLDCAVGGLARTQPSIAETALVWQSDRAIKNIAGVVGSVS